MTNTFFLTNMQRESSLTRSKRGRRCVMFKLVLLLWVVGPFGEVQYSASMQFDVEFSECKAVADELGREFLTHFPLYRLQVRCTRRINPERGEA